MNYWSQILRLAFLIGSFRNILGSAGKAAVGKRFNTQDKSGFENAVSFMRSRRMMLGIGSVASSSNIWGYLEPEPGNPSGYVYSRHREKRSESGVVPAIVLEDGELSEKVSSPQRDSSQGSDSSALESNNIVLSKGKRSEVERSESHTQPTIVLSNGKRSEVKWGESPTQPAIVLSNGKRSTQYSGPQTLAASQKASSSQKGIQFRAADSSELTSKIVLPNGKQSKKARSPQDGIQSRGSDSSELESKIVLSNGKRSEKASFPLQDIQSRAPDSSELTSKIVLSHGSKRSELVGVSQNALSGSGISRRGNKMSKEITASQPSAIESDIVLRNPTKRRLSDSEKWRGRNKIPTVVKKSLVASTPSSIPSVPIGKHKVKRYELDLIPENFAKPLPIFE